ncbi:MAG: hypothetical protein EYC70_01995 [Planctomycetota bacterium]|nr:MAG: hypothetical protein EYC70_01995 [Planctomycetota bacterium]
MNSRSLIPRILLFGGGAALAWALIPGSGEASSSAWRSLDANVAAAAFLQQGPALGWSTATGGGGRNHLPTSAMPNGTVGLLCSVDTSDLGAPPRCSTTAAAPRCSAHCDNAQRCSAFIGAVGAGAAVCSTLGGGANRQCSVLQPVINGTAPSVCSAFGGIPGTTIRCSVMGPGNGQKCSVQNPARFQGNLCSTFPSGAVGGTHQCSVLNGGPLANYCSAGGAVPPGLMTKQCSTSAQNSQCSILPGNKGICTTFSPAPTGSCSILVTPSTCSVIGGANGSFCVQ